MKKIIFPLLLLILSCDNPPADGCLDTAADNYNKKSDVNCCCKYSCTVEFKTDTLDISKFTFTIDSVPVQAITKFDMPKPSRTITYIIKSNDTIFDHNIKNISRGKNNIIVF